MASIPRDRVTVRRISIPASFRPILSGVFFGLTFIAALCWIWIGMVWSVRYGNGVAVLMAFVCAAYIKLAFGPGQE